MTSNSILLNSNKEKGFLEYNHCQIVNSHDAKSVVFNNIGAIETITAVK